MKLIEIQSSIVPLLLLCAISIVGYFVGKIRIFGISLDVAAVLLVAIAVGFVISISSIIKIDQSLNNALDLYSKMGTALFISAIGVSSGTSLAKGSIKKNFLCFLFGAIMVCSAIICAKCIEAADSTFDKSLLIGTLCGALTSTPGLSVVCEDINIVSENAVVGYGAAYLFGVIGVVTFVQWGVNPFNNKERKLATYSEKDNVNSSLVFMFITILFGILLGSIRIPYVKFVLGLTGGLLISGIIVGAITYRYNSSKGRCVCDMDPHKKLGLLMFLAGNGMKAGAKLTSSVDIRCFVYGAIITIITLIIGFLLSKLFYSKETKRGMFIVAGGMTSTPAFGVLVSKESDNDDMASYSLTYLGALICFTLFLKFI